MLLPINNKEKLTMKHLGMFCLLAALSFTRTNTLAFAQGAAAPAPATPAPAPNIVAAVDLQISTYERHMVQAAEAMPEDKFNFTPASLNIPGSAYKDVRTFAQLVKHSATVNFRFWTTLAGEKMPENIKSSNGPDELKTKAEIVQFLKDSFIVGHRAARTLTTENVVEQLPLYNSKAARINIALGAVVHDADEYGQMVEYLRMDGITPPASRDNH
jgi:hypothetical protein